MAKKQRTFHVDDRKITIKSYPKFWHGNPNGYAVEINGTSFHSGWLTREEAEDNAYVRWVKANG